MKTINLIFSFGILAILASCSNDENTAADNQNLQIEQQKLELEKEKLNLEKEKQQLEIDRIKEIEAQKEIQRKNEQIRTQENRFSGYDYAYVKVNKAYFHTQPDAKFKSNKKFLVSGDECDLIKIQNGFAYVEYYNYSVDKTTTGWIDLADLEPTYRGD